MFDLITPVSYWILTILWLAILLLYLGKLRQSKAVGGAVAVLLSILAIDAFRTVFESLYFGLYFNSLFGLLPKNIHDVLSQPSLIIIPKLINVVAGIIVLFLLVRRWIPREIRDREEWINSLKENEERFRFMLDRSPVGVSIAKDGGRDLVYVNPAYNELINADSDEVLGSNPSHYYADSKDYEEVIEALEHGRAVNNRLVKLSGPGGWIKWALASYLPIQYEGETASLGWFFDITDRKRVEDALVESEKKYRGLLDTDPDGMVIVNAKGKIEIVNQQLQRMTGYTPDDLIGQPVEVLVPERFNRHEQQRDSFLVNPHVRMMGEGIALFVRRKDDSEFPAEISLSPLDTEEGLNISASIRDITDRKQAEVRLSYQASHDEMTGLINRGEFERRADRLLSTIQQDKGEHALCFMDLDQFKVINDTCGHIAGDELLRQLGGELKRTVRHRDTLARLGGDEFGVLVEHCSLDQAQRVARELQQVVQDFQFSWEGQSFRVGASIGLVAINETTPNLTELLKQADAACYMAKDLGRNRIHTYYPEDVELAQRHGEMQWVQRINQALEQNRFCLYAQSIVPLGNSTDQHYELLLRMLDEQGEVIPPGAFLPAAERYDLIGLLDAWVIQNAFTLLAANPAFVKQVDFITINLSGPSLTNGDFLDSIISQLKIAGIEPSKICFEVTETVAISNLSAAITFINVLKQVGCRFALDDFGSGLSSFGYLKNLPIDYLKIDGMFVKDMVDDPIDHAMVKSINDIGQVMGMQTIAEFVENDEIKGMLAEIGVNYAQGYGIEKPRPFDELLAHSRSDDNHSKDS